MDDLLGTLKSKYLVPEDWTPVSLDVKNREAETSEVGLDLVFDNFEILGGLAVFQSGLHVLSSSDRRDSLPDLGPALQIELFNDSETRLLRYSGRYLWRLTTCIERAGEDSLCEPVTFIGDHETGVTRLSYHRYWRPDTGGGWQAGHGRLVGLVRREEKP